MENLYILLYDDIDPRYVNRTDRWKILRRNGNDTFFLAKFPYMMTISFKEFKEKYGPIVYLLDMERDEELVEKYKSKIICLEKDKNSSLGYHLVAPYDNKDICVKRTSIAKPTYESSFRFVRIKDIDIRSNIDKEEIYSLKKNLDGTVCITPAPADIKMGIHLYEDINECILVVPIEDDYSYDESKVIKLEETENSGKYRIISYEKPKQIVKSNELK